MERAGALYHADRGTIVADALVEHPDFVIRIPWDDWVKAQELVGKPIA
jgi:hypothetical protein